MFQEYEMIGCYSESSATILTPLYEKKVAMRVQGPDKYVKQKVKVLN